MEVRSRKESYAFVLPRYFSGLAGGAETLAAELAKALAGAGHHTEIFATCARDNRTWENFFEPGRSEEGGLIVNRFKVDQRNLDSWIPKQIAISQGMRLSVDEQLEWMKEGVNSKALYAEIISRQHEFDKIFFAPYLFATTFWGSQMLIGKAVLIPCLHDECYAYQDVIAAMFRRVAACLFNALPEKKLAESLYGPLKGGEVGMGFREFDPEYIARLNPDRRIEDPYLLYLGRKETGKKVDLLIDYFIAAKDSGQLPPEMKLVIAGGGDFADLHRPDALRRQDIADIGHLSEEDKHCLMRDAFLFCQPSTNESFSIVIMESWLLGVPCLVHSDCAVTRYHTEKSGGGLHFSNPDEFSETISLLCREERLRCDMAAAGYDYVKREYCWQAVLARFEQVMLNLSSQAESGLREKAN